MKILIVTQNAPLYLPAFLSLLLKFGKKIMKVLLKFLLNLLTDKIVFIRKLYIDIKYMAQSFS